MANNKLNPAEAEASISLMTKTLDPGQLKQISKGASAVRKVVKELAKLDTQTTEKIKNLGIGIQNLTDPDQIKTFEKSLNEIKKITHKISAIGNASTYANLEKLSLSIAEIADIERVKKFGKGIHILSKSMIDIMHLERVGGLAIERISNSMENLTDFRKLAQFDKGVKKLLTMVSTLRSISTIQGRSLAELGKSVHLLGDIKAIAKFKFGFNLVKSKLDEISDIDKSGARALFELGEALKNLTNPIQIGKFSIGIKILKKLVVKDVAALAEISGTSLKEISESIQPLSNLKMVGKFALGVKLIRFTMLGDIKRINDVGGAEELLKLSEAMHTISRPITVLKFKWGIHKIMQDFDLLYAIAKTNAGSEMRALAESVLFFSNPLKVYGFKLGVKIVSSAIKDLEKINKLMIDKGRFDILAGFVQKFQWRKSKGFAKSVQIISKSKDFITSLKDIDTSGVEKFIEFSENWKNLKRFSKVIKSFPSNKSIKQFDKGLKTLIPVMSQAKDIDNKSVTNLATLSQLMGGGDGKGMFKLGLTGVKLSLGTSAPLTKPKVVSRFIESVKLLSTSKLIKKMNALNEIKTGFFRKGGLGYLATVIPKLVKGGLKRVDTFTKIIEKLGEDSLIKALTKLNKIKGSFGIGILRIGKKSGLEYIAAVMKKFTGKLGLGYSRAVNFTKIIKVIHSVKDEMYDLSHMGIFGSSTATGFGFSGFGITIGSKSPLLVLADTVRKFTKGSAAKNSLKFPKIIKAIHSVKKEMKDIAEFKLSLGIRVLAGSIKKFMKTKPNKFLKNLNKLYKNRHKIYELQKMGFGSSDLAMAGGGRMQGMFEDFSKSGATSVVKGLLNTELKSTGILEDYKAGAESLKAGVDNIKGIKDKIKDPFVKFSPESIIDSISKKIPDLSKFNPDKIADKISKKASGSFSDLFSGVKSKIMDKGIEQSVKKALDGPATIAAIGKGFKDNIRQEAISKISGFASKIPGLGKFIPKVSAMGDRKDVMGDAAQLEEEVRENKMITRMNRTLSETKQNQNLLRQIKDLIAGGAIGVGVAGGSQLGSNEELDEDDNGFGLDDLPLSMLAGGGNSPTNKRTQKNKRSKGEQKRRNKLANKLRKQRSKGRKTKQRKTRGKGGKAVAALGLGLVAYKLATGQSVSGTEAGMTALNTASAVTPGMPIKPKLTIKPKVKSGWFSSIWSKFKSPLEAVKKSKSKVFAQIGKVFKNFTGSPLLKKILKKLPFIGPLINLLSMGMSVYDAKKMLDAGEMPSDIARQIIPEIISGAGGLLAGAILTPVLGPLGMIGGSLAGDYLIGKAFQMWPGMTDVIADSMGFSKDKDQEWLMKLGKKAGVDTTNLGTIGAVTAGVATAGVASGITPKKKKPVKRNAGYRRFMGVSAGAATAGTVAAGTVAVTDKMRQQAEDSYTGSDAQVATQNVALNQQTINTSSGNFATEFVIIKKQLAALIKIVAGSMSKATGIDNVLSMNVGNSGNMIYQSLNQGM